MPYRHAFRSYSSPNDVHMVSLPLNESLEQWPEQEMDFTSYVQVPIPATVIKTTQDDPPHNELGYPQLMDLGSNVPSLHASRTSSIATTSLPASDSELVATNLCQSSLSGSLPEKICPLIAGEIDSCQPARCGPDAPCMNFTNLPPIEECTSVPCISSPSSIEAAGRASRRPQVSTRQRSARAAISEPLPTTPTSAISEPQRSSRRVKKQSAKESNRTKIDAKQRAKAAHSLVEKKYRENLNTQLAMLHNTIQNAYYGPRRALEEFDVDAEMDSCSNSAPKFRKSEVLSDAMTYINQTEVEMRHMENEIQRLGERVKMLEKLVEV